MKPIRLLCIAILGMVVGSAKCAQQSDNRQPATELKNAIENKDFQVITLTRPLGNNYPLLLNEIQFLFDDISRAFNTDLLLRNSCNDDVTNLTEILSQAKNEYDKKKQGKKILL